MTIIAPFYRKKHDSLGYHFLEIHRSLGDFGQKWIRRLGNKAEESRAYRTA